jgi:guanylate kinase
MNAVSARGELFIVSAPSGAGKTTLIQAFLEGPAAAAGGFAFSVSHTTRRPRAGEQDGVAYHFVDREAFASMIEAGAFLEWAEVYGNFYGTSSAEVLPRLERGIDVLLDIDVQGAARVMAAHPEAQSIFVLPPSYADLERRLRGRALDGGAAITRRLEVSRLEIKCYEMYRYVIINDDASQAGQALAAILLDKRQRRERQAKRIGAILADFEQPSKESS